MRAHLVVDMFNANLVAFLVPSSSSSASLRLSLLSGLAPPILLFKEFSIGLLNSLGASSFDFKCGQRRSSSSREIDFLCRKKRCLCRRFAGRLILVLRLFGLLGARGLLESALFGNHIVTGIWVFQVIKYRNRDRLGKGIKGSGTSRGAGCSARSYFFDRCF